MDYVQILMSTYNGEAYLEKQLDSIILQTYPNIKLLIRDDGSSDGTLEILERYSNNYKCISYYQGENVGVIKSFFDLLYNSDDCAIYFGFADQDDEWLPQKVERAVKMIKGKNTEKPILYCSDTYIADEMLNIIKKDNKKPSPSWGNALVQNICTGCTAMMNHSLRDIVKQTKPENIVMHDWWLYLTAELFGMVCYDNRAYIKYRQHGKNICGVRRNSRDVWKYRIQQLREKRGYIFDQVEEVEKCYLEIEEEKYRQLKLVINAKKGFWNRVKLVHCRTIYRNSKIDDLVYRAVVLIGKL